VYREKPKSENRKDFVCNQLSEASQKYSSTVAKQIRFGEFIMVIAESSLNRSLHAGATGAHLFPSL
jgi:hypothetical protein